jgi:hypothetical protein
MGNMMRRDQGAVQAAPQQGMMYAPQQRQYAQQPVMQPQPQYVQQPAMQPQPQYVQQPMMQPQHQYVQQSPQYLPQQTGQFRPSMSPPQQGGYQPSYPSGPSMPRYPTSPLSLSHGHDPSIHFENDEFLANLTGWSPQDIERLRHEFLSYTNSYGVIDRDGFRKLYIASLLNMTWEALEHDAETAFRNFDLNQTGFLDFNEYITACSRMTREVNASYSSPPPSMNPSYNY